MIYLQKKGFTLIELIMVITILAILATIGFVSFQRYKVQVLEDDSKNNISEITQPEPVETEFKIPEKYENLLNPLEKLVFEYKSKSNQENQDLIKEILKNSIYFENIKQCDIKNKVDKFVESYNFKNWIDKSWNAVRQKYIIWVSEIEDYKGIMTEFCKLNWNNSEFVKYNAKNSTCEKYKGIELESTYSIDPELSLAFWKKLSQEDLFLNVILELDKKCFYSIVEETSKNLEKQGVDFENY